MTAQEALYHYAAAYVGNYDGDTITFDVDLGFHTRTKIRVRLYGVDTDEMRGGTRESKEAARAAKREVERLLEDAGTIYIRTHKDKQGGFGRWLATVYVDGVDLNAHLLREGFAEPYRAS